ncbi:MAG: redoxin domain-containing protein [Sedimentisphaerales bacterium]|nr:redoxin domain-containing protein [Sedimentisphaerales bacterium]
MRRTATLTTMCLVLFLATSAGLGQQTERPARPVRGQAPAGQREGMQRLAQRLQQQIDELKAAHEGLIAELRAIHESAVKEKATGTAEKVETLISRRQGTFQARLSQLQQQQQRLRRAGRDRAGQTARPQRRGRQAPEFQLSSFDGQKVKLSEHKGKIVVLEWFNFECPFSRYHYEKASTMADLAKKYKDKGVVWFAVNSTSHTTAAANREFAKKHKVPYPILNDTSGKVGRAYAARTTPHIIIIDKEGYIAYNGAIDTAPLGQVKGEAGKINYVDKALAELTSGQNVSTPATSPYGCSVKYADR